MNTCNIMTGSGFDLGLLGGFSMAWIGLVFLIFIIIFARRYIGEEAGVPFNPLFAFVAGIISYGIAITFTCEPKWALLAGLIGGGLGAYFGGALVGEGGFLSG